MVNVSFGFIESIAKEFDIHLIAFSHKRPGVRVVIILITRSCDDPTTDSSKATAWPVGADHRRRCGAGESCV